MKTLVVARWKEKLDWLRSPELNDWNVVVYDKGAGQLPNWPGRDLHTHLHHIAEHYNSISDDVAFVQGNPFDHDKNVLVHLTDESVRLYGMIEACKPNGMPRIENMHLNEYAKAIGIPQREVWRFVCGAQLRVSAVRILAYPKSFYDRLLFHSMSDPYSSWRLERLWAAMFGLL